MRLNKGKIVISIKKIRAFLGATYYKGIRKYQMFKRLSLLFWRGDAFLKQLRLSEEWQERIADVVACPDNAHIPRHFKAGRVKNGVQFMHNGLKINFGSYYGHAIARLLYENRGVHEPQEEYIFGQVLTHLPTNAIIVELGAYWGFYSMWFLSVLPQAKAYLVEPDAENLKSGQSNFKLNGFKGHFTQAYIGAKSVFSEKLPTVNVDDFLTTHALDFVHILHADIQFAELDMLYGALQSIENQRIGYVFISTHSNELHYQCLNWLTTHDFIIVAETDLADTFSFDGLIVGRSKYFEGITEMPISRKSQMPILR